MGLQLPILLSVRGRLGPDRSDGGIPGRVEPLTSSSGEAGSRPRDSGMVILEFALVVPLIFFVALCAAWLLRVGQAQAQLDDAVRTTAREIARGTDRHTAGELGQQIFPGARIKARETGSAPLLVTTVGTYRLNAPIPNLDGFHIRLRSEMIAVKEDVP